MNDFIEINDALGVPDWNIEEFTGFEPSTDFYLEFSLAEESGGLDAVMEKFAEAFEEAKCDKMILSELILVLNFKALEHYGTPMHSFYRNLNKVLSIIM